MAVISRRCSRRTGFNTCAHRVNMVRNTFFRIWRRRVRSLVNANVSHSAHHQPTNPEHKCSAQHDAHYYARPITSRSPVSHLGRRVVCDVHAARTLAHDLHVGRSSSAPTLINYFHTVCHQCKHLKRVDVNCLIGCAREHTRMCSTLMGRRRTEIGMSYTHTQGSWLLCSFCVSLSVCRRAERRRFNSRNDDLHFINSSTHTHTDKSRAPIVCERIYLYW